MSEQQRAFQMMFVIAACASLVLTIPYFVEHEEAEKARPWMAGDPIPFAHWWGGDREASKLPGLAGEFVHKESTRDEAEEAGVNEELMNEARDDSSEDELIAPDGPPEPTPPDPPGTEPEVRVQPEKGSPSPAPSPVKEPAKEPVKRRPTITVDPAEYRGLKEGITDPSGKALDAFYTALARTARREKGAITRISHYGDSVIGADGLTSAARRKLQKTFGNGGKGWVNLAPFGSSYIQKDVIYRQRHWRGTKTVLYGGLRRGMRKGRYGYGGSAARSPGGGRSSYRVYADHLELYYFAYPKGGKVAVKIDDGEWIQHSTQADTPMDAWKTFHAEKPGGEHTFTVRAAGDGALVGYGVALERKTPGVVYDCLAMIGTRADRLLHYDTEHLKAQVAHRKPNLQILMFGGNELGDKRMALRPYKKKYLRVIQNVRAGAPNASCMIMSPVDHGERWRGRVRTEPLLKRLIPVMKAIAAESGCAFFNTFAAMGGEGAAGRWRRMKPTLVSGDLAHLTKAGGRVVGTMLYKALMKGFADWATRTKAR